MLSIVPSSDSNTASLVGELVGDYRVEELRSDGTHYAIYRGVHRKLERQAEVRVHHLQHCGDSMHERIEQSARIISRIRHPNVVELYDYGKLSDGRAYVVREWVQGTLLRDRNTPLAPEESSRVLAELCSGIAAMHQVGLSHGELSQDSVMLSHTGEAVKIVGPLLDRSSDQRRAATVGGDINALGGLIEELFAARSESATEGNEPLVPRDIDAIVRRCRGLGDEEQFASVVSVAQALDDALSGSGERDDGLAPGTLIADTYRVYAVIGSGGMGKVYEAVHKRLPQRVAIKVISGEHQAESLARFRQEAEIASSVGHPHIVRVFDFNTLPDGRPYMVMEFLEGEDLAKTLSRGAVPPDRALVIVGQIGSALSAAHAKGIVHRDLKPPNIFLGSVEIGGERREHATVLDFGVSKKADAETAITQTSAIIGTPRYMAPEQAMGKHDDVGPASDQFALGCIMYEMLTGRRCFGGRDLAEIIHSVCYVDPIPLDQINSELAPAITAAVQRAMAKAPGDRFPSMADFVAALEGRTLPSLAADDTVTATPAARSHDIAVEKVEKVASVAAESPATMETVASRPSSRSVKLAADEATAATVSEPEPPSAPASTAGDSRRALSLGLTVVVAILAGSALAYYGMTRGGAGTGQDSAPADARFTAESFVVVMDAGKLGTLDAMPEPLDVGDAHVNLGDAGSESSDVQELPGRERTGPGEQGQETRHPKGASSPKAAYSQAVASALDTASSQLRAGKYVAARKTLRVNASAAKTPRGYAITVMSFCGEHNFGAATDWIAQVSRSDRRDVRRYCKSKHGVDLD